MTLYFCDLPSQTYNFCLIRKKIRKIPVERFPTKYLSKSPQNCQDNKKQDRCKKKSQSSGAQETWPLNVTWISDEDSRAEKHHSVSSVQSFSCVWLLETPWTAAHQASLSITNCWGLLKLMPIESVIPSNHLILCCPLLLPPSIFPSIRVFSNDSALPISFLYSPTLTSIHDHWKNHSFD